MKLSELVVAQPKSKIKAGFGLENGAYPFYTSSPILIKSYDEYQFEGPALIFGTGGTPSVHYVEGKFSTSTDCLVLYPKSRDVNLKLLYAYLDSMSHVLGQGFKGSGLKHISKKYILDIELPQFDFKSDFYGLGVLDKIKRMISFNEGVLDKLEDLVKSRFVEMFGDPIENPFGWQKYPLGEVYRIIDGDRGKNYPKSNEFSNEGYCLFLNAGNVTKDGFSFVINQFISQEKDGLLRNGKLQREDLVVTTRGTVGNVAHYDEYVPFENLRINSGMVILRPVMEIVKDYFIEFFSYPAVFNSLISGTAQPQMPIRSMKKTEILLPPLAFQQEFTFFVAQVNKLKLDVQQSIDKLQEFYDSLAQEYFGGEGA